MDHLAEVQRSTPIGAIPATGGASSYLPALDGLRAVAIMLVIVAHLGLGQIVPGAFGVTLFFFISGFIISRLLLAEHAANGRIDFLAFYARRVLRLGPPLVLFLALILAGMLVIPLPTQPVEFLPGLFYYANYYAIWHGFTDGENNPISILWSLAVEEHFYLLFPILLLLRPRTWAPIILAMLVATLVWRCWLYAHCIAPDATGGVCGAFPDLRTYMATDTRLDAIGFGVIVTLIGSAAPWHRRAAWFIAAALGLLILSFVVRNGLFREAIRYTVQGLALTVLVPALLFSPRLARLRRLCEGQGMVLIGRWSYSLYLFHWLAMCVATGLAAKYSAAWEATVVILAGTLTLICYYLIEIPMRRVRARLRR